MRLHHWIKNGLLLVVPGLHVQQAGGQDLVALAAGFFLFGLAASGGYILNDLFDRSSDRRHRTKRYRPVAAGTLNAAVAAVGALALLIGSVGGGLLLDTEFGGLLAAYVAACLFYSTVVKKVAGVDVVFLSALLCLRVIAGAVLISTPVPFWLLGCAGLLFLGLACAKRHGELIGLSDHMALPRRGYSGCHADALFRGGILACAGATVLLPLSATMLPTSMGGTASMLVLAVSAVQAVWLWHFWSRVVAGTAGDDPVAFALQDRLSFGCLAVVVGGAALHSMGPFWKPLF